MASLVVRNLDQRIVDALKQRAARHGRKTPTHSPSERRTLDTAIAETRFHSERFLRYSAEPAIRLEMRAYYADISTDLHDLHGADHSLFDPDPANYPSSQVVGVRLKKNGSNGVMYSSVRRSEGECVGVFRPCLVSPVRQGPHFEYRWDGNEITEVMKVRRYDTPLAS